MWYQLLIKQKTGYKFMRQKPIGNYIVDFYSPDLKLAIEVDGDTHFVTTTLKNINGIYTDLIELLPIKNLSSFVRLFWLFT